MIRSLTIAERDLAREVFGAELDAGRVRILSAPWPFKRAFVPGRWFWRDWIVWPARNRVMDFAGAPLSQQAVFIHELVHVWQAQQGVNLLWAKIDAGDSHESYAYPLGDDCDWCALNIEQQAMAVEHAFRLGRGGTAPASAAFYRSILPFRRD